MLLLAAARPASAQGPPSDSADRALAAVELGATRLAGAWIPQAGGTLAIRLSTGLELGGSGRIGLRHATLADGGSELRLQFGYGGLKVMVRPIPAVAPGLRLGMLVGAGNADLEDPTAGTVIDSDNGGVLEPMLSLSTTFLPRLTGALSFSWRLAFAFEALGGLESRKLRGPSLNVALVLGPF